MVSDSCVTGSRISFKRDCWWRGNAILLNQFIGYSFLKHCQRPLLKRYLVNWRYGVCVKKFCGSILKPPELVITPVKYSYVLNSSCQISLNVTDAARTSGTLSVFLLLLSFYLGASLFKLREGAFLASETWLLGSIGWCALITGFLRQSLRNRLFRLDKFAFLLPSPLAFASGGLFLLFLMTERQVRFIPSF